MSQKWTLICFFTMQEKRIVNLLCCGRAHHVKQDQFHSNHYQTLIDKGCFACITNKMSNFDCKSDNFNANIHRVEGAIKLTHYGTMLTHKSTIKWSLKDNEWYYIPFISMSCSLPQTCPAVFGLHNIGVKMPLAMVMGKEPSQQHALIQLS